MPQCFLRARAQDFTPQLLGAPLARATCFSWRNRPLAEQRSLAPPVCFPNGSALSAKSRNSFNPFVNPMGCPQVSVIFALANLLMAVLRCDIELHPFCFQRLAELIEVFHFKS